MPVEAPRRLHPISVVRGFQVRDLVGLVIGAGFVARDTPLLAVALFAVGAAITGVVRVLAWRRHTYELTGDRIVERSGILSRSERTLELARIQQVDVQRSILDRLVGTAELRMETAADAGDSEITLTVVAADEADRLRAELDRAAAALRQRSGTSRSSPETAAATGDPGAGDAEVAEGEGAATGGDVVRAGATGSSSDERRVLVSVPLAHVALATATGRRLLLLPAGAAVLLSIAGDLGFFRRADDVGRDVLLELGVVGAAVALLLVGLVALAATVVAGVLRDARWTLSADDDVLRVRRGLTTERTATVPRSRVQRVTVDRSWLRGLLGFSSVTIHSAGGLGGGQDPNQQLDRQLTVPLLPDADVDALVDELLGTSDGERPRLQPHPPVAGRRAMVRGGLGTLPLLLPLVALVVVGPLPPVVLVLAPLLVVGGVVAGLQRHRQRASGASPRLVGARTGLVGTSTAWAPRRKVQGGAVVATVFQRRRGLASLRVHLAGPSGGVEMVDLDAGTAGELARELASDQWARRS